MRVLENFLNRLDEKVFEHIHLVEVGERFVFVFESDGIYVMKYFFEIFGNFLDGCFVIDFSFGRKRSYCVSDDIFFSEDVFFE